MRRSSGSIARFSRQPLAAAVAALIGSGYAAGAVQAQSVEASGIEEIIVTASRRETTVQEVPFNIAAFGGETLESQRITNLSELSRWVPGLTVVEQGPRSSSLMTARGLNTLSLGASEILNNTSGETVATYLGEIPVYVDFKMNDLDRVEVLLGPQGTLYGAGTLGGAVRYIPAAPDTREFSLEANGDLYGVAHSNGSGYKAGIVVNAPIVEDRLAFRASFNYLDDPGFTDYLYLVREPGVSNPQPDLNNPGDVAANLYRQNDADWEETFSSRLALLWNVTDSVEATFNYYYQSQDVGGRTINQRDAFGTGNYESAQRFVEPNDRDNDLVSVEVVADLGFAQLTSATGFSQFDTVGQRDQTDLLLDFESNFYEQFPSFVAFTREDEREERVNEEIRLVSTSTGPLSWLGGFFYNDFERSGSSSEFTPGLPAYFGASLPTGDLEFYRASAVDLKETALFGEIGYALTDRWSVAVGGRAFDYEFRQSVEVLLPFVDSEPGFSYESVDDDGFLTKVNTSYDFSDDVMGYVTLSEGYRVGGANSVTVCEPGGPTACASPDEVLIKPDTTTNFEVGVHTQRRDGRLIFNAALYRIDWDDMQTLGETAEGALSITVNAGEARTQGLELSLQSRGQRWSFMGSYAYNDAKLTSTAIGLVDGAVDGLPGDRLSGTPEHQGSFHAAYTRPLSNGWDLDVGYGLTFRSDVLTKIALRNEGETLGGYTIHSLSAGISEGRWSARLFADNLTDKFAETGARDNRSTIRDVGGFAVRRYFRYVLRPRVVGIEFRYRMGG
jgi:outer membrane receptor protein involved in Fe transport